MKLIKLDIDFTVCKIQNIGEVCLDADFVFLSKTDEEISLVCDSRCVPQSAYAVNAGWKALKIDGILDFAMTGVIASIVSILSAAGISVFVISTVLQSSFTVTV